MKISKVKKAKGTQLTLQITKWGGKRAGAGRPNKSGARNHMARPQFSNKHPLHATLRLKKGLTGLRCKAVHTLFQSAIKEIEKFGVRVNHYSIQGNHLHMIIEAKSAAALVRAMKSFGCRFAKGVKKILGLKSEAIFNGRYHISILKNPTQTRNALKYVLLNQSKHSKLIEHVDLYSSGHYFQKWDRLLGEKYADLMAWQTRDLETGRSVNSTRRASAKSSAEANSLPPYLHPPQTWLLREGWLKTSRHNKEATA